MIRFSEIDFEDELYCMPGRVDEYSLESCTPLRETLSLMDNHEILNVFYTVYLLDDGDTQSTRDAQESEVRNLEQEFSKLLGNGTLHVQEEGIYKIYGFLPKPFEDYYQLKGTARREYLAAKSEEARERNRLTSELSAEGLSQDEIDQWFRFNYYV